MAPVDHSGAYTAVVSGASGFIGTELVKQLLEKGYNVKAIVKPKAGPKGKVYTEEDWNAEADENAQDADAYRYSKVAAKREAWDASKKHKFEVVTICPTFVLGPVISNRADATSILDVKGLIEGTNDSVMPWVCDVRDIARAHILAAEVPSAKGRYLVSQDSTVPVKTLTHCLSKHFPNLKFAEGKESEAKHVSDNSKVQEELGLSIHPWQESIIDMATTLMQRGIAKSVSK